jgi:hypothetical protein
MPCDPRDAYYRRILVICPSAIAAKYSLEESGDMETFGAHSFLRLWPRPYTPVNETRLEFYGSTGHPKVSRSRYGFTAEIQDQRRGLYLALQEVMVNSYTSALPKGSRWRAVTVVDFCNPGPQGYETGTDETGQRYIIRNGMISLSSPGMEMKPGLSGSIQLEFKSHNTSLAPGYALTN